MSTKFAKFWDWDHDSQAWVGIALADGDTYEKNYGGPTEEGFSNTSITYARRGDTIYSSYNNSSRDCDGPHSSYSESKCLLTNLAKHEASDAMMTPEWEPISSGQRDVFAEAMGY